MSANDDFEIADRAYAKMRRDQRLRVLTHFAALEFPSVVDRFFEAVHRVIIEGEPDATHAQSGE